MKILKTTLPKNSILTIDQKKYDYVDSFEGIYTDKDNNISSDIVGKAFFTSAPTWVSNLLELRNKIVGIFGLKTSGQANNRATLLKNFKCEPNERLGLFKVFDRTENEVVLGEDDKHLNFRVSLLKSKIIGTNQNKLTITTTVEFKNWYGKLYFLPVKPFHSFIVPTMLKGIIRALEK